MAGSQPEPLGERLAAERGLKVFLNVEAKRFVGTDRLARAVYFGRAEQAETGVQQRFGQEAGERAAGLLVGGGDQRRQDTLGNAIVDSMDAAFESAGAQCASFRMAPQADADLVGAEKKRQHFNRPIRSEEH